MKKLFTIAEGRIAESTDAAAPIQVFVGPDESERRFLVDQWKVDEHTLSSALDPDELSRLEFEPEHVAIIYKRPRNYSGDEQLMFKVSSAGIFAFKDRLFIVLSEDVPLFHGKIFNKVAGLSDLLLRLLYGSIHHYLEHLKIINAITDDLEKKVSASLENKYLAHFFTLQKSLVYYLNSINSNGILMERIKNASAKLGFSQDQIELLDDIIIENNQCYRQAEIYSNILASLMDARVSIVSNNLNILMKTLNLITIGIMLPTLVVSAFSMNVKIPFQQYPHAFWLIIGLAAASLVGGAVWWRLKKW
jgi:magnesium transporter